MDTKDPIVLNKLIDALFALLKAKSNRVHHIDARQNFAALFQIVDMHRGVLIHANPELESDTIDNWVLDAVIHNELFTDDSFRFAKAAKAIMTHLNRRQEAVANENHNDVQQLDAVLFPCLRTLMARHSTSWAKTSVEMVMKWTTAHRLTFPETYREEIDRWTAMIQQRKNVPSRAVSSASELRKNIIPYNDTQTGVKVGKSNHPLFNKG